MDTMDQQIFASTGLSLLRYDDLQDESRFGTYNEDAAEAQRLVDWVWN